MKRLRGFVLVVAALASACDSGPKGPGTLSAVVISDQKLGAVVLEFTGGTIEGFEGRGDTRVYSATQSSTATVHRLILVSPSGSDLRFGIRVLDREAENPVVTAVTATSIDNQPLVPSGLQIRIEN